MNDLRRLKPFTRFCCTIGNLPSSYMTSLTYEEQIMWLCDYLKNTIIPTIDNNTAVVEELQNYLINLNVQNEINNKLDEMAQNGQLSEIIAQYLQLAGVLAFNTKALMKSATNITENSICRTLGKNNYLDGQGALYKIRTITSSDVVDEENIISLNIAPTLIAEKIPFSSNYENYLNLQNKITQIETTLLTELVVIGDSYTAKENSNWAENVSNQLNLNLHKNAYSGMAFYRPLTEGIYNNATFLTLLNEFADNTKEVFMNENERLKVKYVITYGGVNDWDSSVSTFTRINNAVYNYCNRAKELFPNAQIIIVGPQATFNGYKDQQNIIIGRGMANACSMTGCTYINASDWLISTPIPAEESYESTFTHPGTQGYNIITSKMLGVINNSPLNSNEGYVTLTPENVTSGKIIYKITKDLIILDINVVCNLNPDTPLEIGQLSISNIGLIENSIFPLYAVSSQNKFQSLLGKCYIALNKIYVENNFGSANNGRVKGTIVLPFPPRIAQSQ